MPICRSSSIRPTHVVKWGLFDRDPMPTWTRGRITLLGDAAHPMLPFLSQGAAMAIEDAFVLARALAGRERSGGGADGSTSGTGCRARAVFSWNPASGDRPTTSTLRS